MTTASAPPRSSAPRRPAKRADGAAKADRTSPATLRNLGPRTADRLGAIGIRSVAQLRRVGAVAAYVKLKRHWPAASLNALYALAGAIEGCDWRALRRARRLELLMAVEAHEQRHPPGSRRSAAGDELRALRNVGPAMRRDFALLGIRSRAQLARCSADALYARLARVTGARQDPCVWDSFAAAIHQAKTGEALPWWHFTPERKRREAEGRFGRSLRPPRPPRAPRRRPPA